MIASIYSTRQGYLVYLKKLRPVYETYSCRRWSSPFIGVMTPRGRRLLQYPGRLVCRCTTIPWISFGSPFGLKPNTLSPTSYSSASFSPLMSQVNSCWKRRRTTSISMSRCPTLNRACLYLLLNNCSILTQVAVRVSQKCPTTKKLRGIASCRWYKNIPLRFLNGILRIPFLLFDIIRFPPGITPESSNSRHFISTT